MSDDDQKTDWIVQTLRRAIDDCERQLETRSVARLQRLRKKFGIDPSETLRQLDELFKVMLRGTEELASGWAASKSDSLWAQLHDSIGEEATAPRTEFDDVLTDRFQAALARDVILRIAESADRAFSLFAAIRNLACSPRTRTFLARVSRCYVFGFDPECVILCRGVLDAEFEAEISADDCIRVLGLKVYGLNDRIIVAHELGRIREDARAVAIQVKRLGDKCIHRTPSLPWPSGNAFYPRVVILNTIAILEELITGEPQFVYLLPDLPP